MPTGTDPVGGTWDTPLIVDALNVIGSRPDGWWHDRAGAIRALAERLRDHAEQRGATVTMVIDGRPLAGLAEGAHGPLEVCYATRGGPNAADDRIVALVEERGAPLAVVTADRDLRRRVERHGATTVGPATLLRALDDQRR